MKLLLELSMECESLARAEAVACASSLGGGPAVVHSEPGVIIVETSASPEVLGSRLALCHHVSEWLGTCTPETVEAEAEHIDVPGPIRVRSTRVGETTVDLSAVSRKVGAVVGRGRGVDLQQPCTEVRVVLSTAAHFGRAIAAVERSAFERRKNRHMPFVYPASLHPKFARALVNLTRAPPGSSLLDPFCGTGAIVAEASMCGMHAIGADFDQKMIDGAKMNLRHLGLEARLELCDVGEIQGRVGSVDGVVTDPPYGRSTSTDGERIPELYARAFRAFSEVLRKGSRTAVVVPDVRLLEGAEGFALLEQHCLRVHRSLTRTFCVLERA